jgi:hypothetical protein
MHHHAEHMLHIAGGDAQWWKEIKNTRIQKHEKTSDMELFQYNAH